MSLLPVLSREELPRRTRVAIPSDVAADAASIVERVRTAGEAALRTYAETLDGLSTEDPLVLEPGALREALNLIPADHRGLLERTAGRIREFAQAQRSSLTDLRVRAHGLEMGHRIDAVPVAGCYAPGGRYPLPSSVLMTVVTARVAGADTVVVASPRPAPVMLAAAAVAGADLFVTTGGAQAIAALAFGTGPVPECDVIVGPGNAWVTAAKKIVAGQVRIDALAGPSELAVVADRSSSPELIAADLLAQAEHDPHAVPLLIVLDADVIEPVERELERQLAGLPSADVARAALRNGGAVVAKDPTDAVALCNLIAPEHLQWVARDDGETRALRHFGGLFIGDGAAEVLGDYGAGPNHVLPTGGQARSRGGLSVLDFLKVSTWMRSSPGSDSGSLARDAARLAEIEGLAGHAAAARMRLPGTIQER